MPAISPQALQQRYQRKLARHRQRMATDPAYAEHCRVKARSKEKLRRKRRMGDSPAYRAKINAKHRAKSKAKTTARRAAYDALPFVGCDGEGIKKDDNDHFALFRMGDRELFRDGRRLATGELLTFIVNCPPDQINVAFAFDYDVSNILRDVSAVRPQRSVPSPLEKILQVDVAGKPGTGNPFVQDQWTFVQIEGRYFGVKYIPRKFLKVCRGAAVSMELANGDFASFPVEIPETSRVIFDTFGFFAPKSFLRTIQDWQIGIEHHEQIAANKARRAQFSGITDEIRDYCRLECELLAQLMTAFRAVCLAADIVPKTWNGAGAIASMLHKRYSTVTAKELEKLAPDDLQKLANRAYYGGRFETTRTGWLPKTWGHDIGSAYPYAMTLLPCLRHGKWVRRKARRLAAAGDDAIYICPVAFEHPPDQFLCGLPFRQKTGALCWPLFGRGIYWSVEIRSAKRLGATVKHGDGWLYQKRCDCQPFGWVQQLYEQRKALGKSTKGYPIKIGINALYGKLAQIIGNPTWRNPIHAGLITAITRAMLNDAIVAAGQKNVVMLATDAIYTIKRPAPVQLGAGLGQWERQEFPKLFIVRPGLYWPPKPVGASWAIKTRGLSPKFFEPRIKAFEQAWLQYARAGERMRAPPVLPVEVPIFVGLKLAYRRGNLASACRWITVAGAFSFAWHTKRVHRQFTADHRAMILDPLDMTRGAHSETYDSADERRRRQLELFEVTDRNLAEHFEAMPDAIDLGIPFA